MSVCQQCSAGAPKTCLNRSVFYFWRLGRHLARLAVLTHPSRSARRVAPLPSRQTRVASRAREYRMGIREKPAARPPRPSPFSAFRLRPLQSAPWPELCSPTRPAREWKAGGLIAGRPRPSVLFFKIVGHAPDWRSDDVTSRTPASAASLRASPTRAQGGGEEKNMEENANEGAGCDYYVWHALVRLIRTKKG